ncbi:unnamed protein product [Adineta steineri]|uniref:Uncharacterized protein n=1 Tax=Adineta steineri TaxID=433720 RepID=A0A819MYP5_9BILA|nr:unnamed protein product [Adineta steineri]CAF3988928.1 unnamed protein product [Adineta steineri]
MSTVYIPSGKSTTSDHSNDIGDYPTDVGDYPIGVDEHSSDIGNHSIDIGAAILNPPGNAQQVQEAATVASPNLPDNAQRVQEAATVAISNLPGNVQRVREVITVAGGHEQGDASNQLYCPSGFYISDNQTILIADQGNHRIVEWSLNAPNGRVVAGGQGRGNDLNQLNSPTDVIVDKNTNTLIICDAHNDRVVRWPRQDGTSGEPIIRNIACWGLTMDHKGFLYVSDRKKGEVRRYKMMQTNGMVAAVDNGTVVAGSRERGPGLNQLDFPTYLFVDQEQSVYVSDSSNHRVMKWANDAIEGRVVAGGQGDGNARTQLSNPQGVFIDSRREVYVVDQGNHRIMRWIEGINEGSIIGGGNGLGNGANQLHSPKGLSFDQHGRFYVVDCENHRVQRFSIEASCTDEVSMNINQNSAERATTTDQRNSYAVNLDTPPNARCKQNEDTVAGGNGAGEATNQLYRPQGIFVDDDQRVIVADFGNHRIIQWKIYGVNGQVLAGGNERGSGLHQLHEPTDVVVDKETNSLIIADGGNRRVVRWSRCSRTTQGEILIDDIECWGLAMDVYGYLYVSDTEKHEVRRYRLGEKHGTPVAGGNGQGAAFNQLNKPRYIFVDQQQNIYVADTCNHRVMKWNKDAEEGIVVAGSQGEGNTLTQLSYPKGLVVDRFGTLYVADSSNHRVMRWIPGAEPQVTVIVGENEREAGANQFANPAGLSLNRHEDLYVVEYGNHRVQRFSDE